MNIVMGPALVQDVVQSLRSAGWMAMSPEELILRSHYDFLGYSNGPKPKSVDTFHHVNLFMQLGICNDERTAKRAVLAAVKNLVDAGFLGKGMGSDGQMSFPHTCLSQPKRSLQDAVFDWRKVETEKRA